MHIFGKAVVLGVFGVCLWFIGGASAQTFATIHYFEGSPSDGDHPVGIILGPNGVVYGATCTVAAMAEIASTSGAARCFR